MKMSTRVDILIVDVGIKYIERCIPAGATYRSVPIRGELWYVNLLVVVHLLSSLYMRKKYNMGLRGCYVAALAKSARAKCIVTYIDNNNWDFGLSNYLGIRVICVQNATRPRWYVDKLNKCFDCYLVYAPELADPDHQLNIFSREASVVGHLKMGLFFEDVQNGSHPEVRHRKNSIVWVSTYREKEDYEDELKGQWEEYLRVMKIGVDHMARYGAERGYEARVALSSHKKKRSPEKEKRYLCKNLSYKLTFSSDSGGEREWIAYKEVWTSQLVLGVNSTLLFESATIGKRTVLFLPTERVREGIEQVAPFAVLKRIAVFGDSYADFAAKCDEIINLSEREYDEIVNDIRYHVCSFDPGKLPQDRIREKLQQIAQKGLENVDMASRTQAQEI